MRNLKLKTRVCSGELSALGSPQCLSVRMDTHTLLIASPYAVIEYDPRTAQVVSEVSLTAEDFLPCDGSGCVVGIQDLPDQECVCVATATGDVILYNLNTQQLECVGSVDSGLTGMSWSPDQELVTLTTGQQSIIMMTKDFEPITEVPIHQEDFGEGKFITVGWGKKETQFHGSEGKQAAQKKNTEVQPAVSWDDRKPRVTWRGDGQLFAVSAVCPNTGARKVRVWNRECVLQATSETINGLEQALCWKPSGSLIASTQRHPNKHSVVFMEKNGLLHGDFTLPIHKDQAKVKELLWNSDSTVLAVWLEDMTPGQDGHINTQIQLWCVGNYHWYLKQSLLFGSGSNSGSGSAPDGPEGPDPPVCVCWDPERPLVLHVLTCGWRSLTYRWGWSTERSYGDGNHDNANVAVIDGDKVLVTAFAQCVVPPPMSSFELKCPAPVAMAMFCSEEGRTNDIAALTHDTHLHVYQQEEREANTSTAGGFKIITHPPVLKNTYRVDLGGVGSGPLDLRLVVWVRERCFLGVTDGEALDQSKVLVLKPSTNGDALEISSQVCVSGQVISVCYSGRSNSVMLQLEDGTLQKLLWDGCDLAAVQWMDSRGSPVNFPQACEHTALCSVSGEEYPLGLTDRAHLYLGDTELASGVSSFVVCDDFLLLTTHTHTCRCLQLNTQTAKGLVSALGSDGGQNDETLRRVERGSRIVTMVARDTRLILQMPRGNLETIHHRALVLAQLRKRLDSLRFRDAFEVMRKQRINLNLIYDHNPKVFLENVELFVKQVDSVNNINLFLTELREEDTTKSMYPPPGSAPPPSPPVAPPLTPGNAGKKVDIVCDALRNTMQTLDPDRYCLCILTTHVKKTVPELETALQKVHQLRVLEAAKAEEALKYLLFLVDVNELYTHSLGTYDFTLVLMVAEKSQKDPKEYLPFLNMLKSLEPNYQRYTIDTHLKRYSKALTHLSKCGEEYFAEALNLVKDQQLYKEALRLYPTHSPEYKEVSGAYAEHLMGRGHAEQAGLLLWRCGELGRALQAFVGGASWRNALSVANQIPLPPDQLALLARDLADKLLEQRRYTEASVLLEQYAKDCEEAISALITGAAWEEALRLVYLYNRQDIIETNLKPALLEAYSTQVSFLEGQSSLFSRHQTRLATVREEKERAKQELLEEGDCGVEVELYSEASSMLSGSQTGSRYTHSNSRISARSSKNRRKAESKKFSLKEGSPFEDTALLHALTHITHTVDKMREEIQALLRALVLFQYDDQAGALQRDYSTLLSLIETSIPNIWTTHTLNTPVTGPNSTANSITASFQQQRAPPSAQQDSEALTPPKMRTALKWKLTVLD